MRHSLVQLLFSTIVWVFGLSLCFVQTPAYAWNTYYMNGACEQTGTPCRTTVGSSEACCSPQAPDITVCVNQRPCRGIFPYRWPKVPINWTVNLNGMAGKSAFSKLDEATITDALKTAWDAWTKPPCTSFKHTFLGASNTTPTPLDQKVVIYLPNDAEWAQLGLPSEVLAFSNPTPNSKGELSDGDILFNPRPGNSWNVSAQMDQTDIDFTDTALHEIGHTLGLAHSHLGTAVMYYSLRGYGPIYKGLSQDDIDAVCAVYPASNACQSDSDCGACRACQGQVCTERNPPTSKICRPCLTNQDCDANGVCIPGPAGHRCLQRCNQDCCPPGYRCITSGNNKLCTPVLGSCPQISCTQNTDCGANGTCQTARGVCAAPASPYAPQQCHRSCNTDQDCNTSHGCVERIPGQTFCAPTCSSGQLCPEGLHCQRTPRGEFCLPHNSFFCPCQNNGECPLGQVCKNNLCQVQDGGVLFAPCSDQAPCGAGLRCLLTGLGGNRCVQLCNPGACPTGTTCHPYSSGYSICIGLPDRDIGKTCDGLQFRCKEELTCAQLERNSLSGYCVEVCSLSRGCKSGGSCNLQSTSFRYCECGPNASCGVGRICQTIGTPPNQVNMCVCNQSPCPDLCNNQVCDADRGENCANCPDDCPCSSGKQCVAGVCQDSTQTCGNGKCDAGENCSSCAQDCPCPAGQVCQNNACIPSTTSCGNGQCDTARGENCSSCPRDCPCAPGTICRADQCVADTTCGNNICDAGENCSSCPRDCACPGGTTCQNGRCDVPPNACGNGTCDTNETCSSCPQDCRCPQGQRCNAGSCMPEDQRDTCGNGVCNFHVGENCSTCEADCRCPAKHVCQLGICKRLSTQCPLEQQVEKCDPNTGQCEVICSQTGCGCQQSSLPLHFPWILLCFLFFYCLRKPQLRPTTHHT